jgi:hypothetical protein
LGLKWRIDHFLETRVEIDGPGIDGQLGDYGRWYGAAARRQGGVDGGFPIRRRLTMTPQGCMTTVAWEKAQAEIRREVKWGMGEVALVSDT